MSVAWLVGVTAAGRTGDRKMPGSLSPGALPGNDFR